MLPAACWQFDTIQQQQQPSERRSAKCYEDFEGNKLKEAQGQTMILLTKSSILQDTKAGTAGYSLKYQPRKTQQLKTMYHQSTTQITNYYKIITMILIEW